MSLSQPDELVSLRRVEPRFRRAVAAMALAVDLGPEPFCIVDVRNRYSATLQAPPDAQLSPESRRKFRGLRGVFSPHQLKDAGPEAAEQSLYVEEWTSLDDVIAQVSLALLQFGIVEQGLRPQPMVD